MVKIQNVFGDIKKGKQDNAIYQLHYGRQIRRVGYKEKIQPSLRQINQRIRFKNAVNWVKNLSVEEKNHIKQYFRQVYPYYEKGQPATWYNFAKNFVLTLPEFQLIDSETGLYQIKHPAIKSVVEYTADDKVLNSYDNLSSLPSLNLCDTFERTCNPATSYIIVTTLPGCHYKYKIKLTVAQLIYCDIRYCNPLYCK